MFIEMEDDTSDPLAILLTWSFPVREKVAKTLEPLCYFTGLPQSKTPSGELRFYNAIDDADLRDKVFKLAYATQYELGLRKDHRLPESQAESLANDIAAQQCLHQTTGRRGSKKSKLVVPAAGKA
jgi:hypothetical protein